MRRWMTIVCAVMVLFLTACGGNGGDKTPADAKDVDLEEVYEAIEAECGWDDQYMVETEGEMLDMYYPGLSEIDTDELVAKAPMMSAVVNEVVLAECKSDEDAARVVEILEERIRYQVGNENNPGGAWYPESIEAWKKAEVVQHGRYVALVASAEYQDAIVEKINQSFS